MQFRLHSTVLYNSIYRADDELLVNPHVHGAGGAGPGHASSPGGRRRYGPDLPGHLRAGVVPSAATD
ncbi:MAG: hypothetical protein ACRDSL_18870 [Pseudonocardiaceae bacterium]